MKLHGDVALTPNKNTPKIDTSVAPSSGINERINMMGVVVTIPNHHHHHHHRRRVDNSHRVHRRNQHGVRRPRLFFLGVVAVTCFALLGPGSSCFSAVVADHTAATAPATSTTPPPTTKSKPSIPRSVPRSNSVGGMSDSGVPPWTLSPNIDEDGFLRRQYIRVPGEWEEGLRIRGRHVNLDRAPPARIRQVPGDGNCLFHAISTCYAFAVNGTHIDLVGGRRNKSNNNVDDENSNDKQWLYQHSTKLRQLAVDQLEDRHSRKLLFLQGREYLRARDLVDSAASQYGISGTEYCDLMRRDSYWGGGPEIVALCNALQRPIHVYELHVAENHHHHQQQRGSGQKRKHHRNNKRSTKKTNSHGSTDDRRLTQSSSSAFVLRRMACFGSPKFDRHEPLHILSADSRFPDIEPGNHLPVGNHFLAIFPEPITHPKRNHRHGDETEDEEYDDDEISGGLLRGGYDDGSPSHGQRIIWSLLDWWENFWS